MTLFKEYKPDKSENFKITVTNLWKKSNILRRYKKSKMKRQNEYKIYYIDQSTLRYMKDEGPQPNITIDDTISWTPPLQPNSITFDNSPTTTRTIKVRRGNALTDLIEAFSNESILGDEVSVQRILENGQREIGSGIGVCWTVWSNSGLNFTSAVLQDLKKRFRFLDMILERRNGDRVYAYFFLDGLILNTFQCYCLNISSNA
ncbi:hypothetical protein KUTeg_023025 [Tegillarca granosa]|uniref:Uncharacterized protein n=1 Tax=Tegillarca granosa TaxID=220873 RepID=A0ABQ9E634_TEGGR|nr:hypothetical protein KUTeg_023025 [Tegillarca granosa]